jgi:Tol biopolymer transport system component
MFRATLVRISFALLVSALALGAARCTQGLHETILSTDNAYNPIPSPDGRYIAYVRTGWGRLGGSGGFGRSNLVSEVMVIDQNGTAITARPLTDMFLQGWTPDGKRLICFRDGMYTLVSMEGKRTVEGSTSRDSKGYRITEWVAYAPSLAEIVWSGVDDGAGGAIATPTRTIVRQETSRLERVIPSPDGRYLAVLGETPQTDLRVYDLSLASWTDFGQISIHPDKDWGYIQPNWSPWFVDGTRLVFLRNSTLIVASPDGTKKTEIQIGNPAGLPVPSPDGQAIAYVTFEPRPRQVRSDHMFWGGTTIMVVSASAGATGRPVTRKDQDEVFDLKWLDNNNLVFDRLADTAFYRHARIWKAAVAR